MAVPRRERVIVNKRDIPAGYIAMCKVPPKTYERIKKASQRLEIDSVCLYPDGDRRRRPRKFVDAGQVKEWLAAHPLHSDRKNVFIGTGTRVPQTIPGTGADALDAGISESVFLKLSKLVDAISLLTVVVQDVGQQLNKALAAQGERELFELSQGN
jgi:hypothetical protein